MSRASVRRAGVYLCVLVCVGAGALLTVTSAAMAATPTTVPDCTGMTAGQCYNAATAAGYQNIELVPLVTGNPGGYTGTVGDVANASGGPNQCPLVGHAPGDGSGCSPYEEASAPGGTLAFTFGVILPDAGGTLLDSSVVAGCTNQSGWWATCQWGPNYSSPTPPAGAAAILAAYPDPGGGDTGGGPSGGGGGGPPTWAGSDSSAFIAGFGVVEMTAAFLFAFLIGFVMLRKLLAAAGWA